jgi:hypothetical protein
VPGAEVAGSLRAERAGGILHPLQGCDLERIFSMQHQRVVAKDNTVRL